MAGKDIDLKKLMSEGISMKIDSGNAYSVFELKGKLIKEVNSKTTLNAHNLSNPSGALDSFHIQNFLDGISLGTKLHADILSGHKSKLLVQLGNIVLFKGNTLHLDPSNGHIMNDDVSEKLWSREYQPGWEPTI